jgi:hypothetical protein
LSELGKAAALDYERFMVRTRGDFVDYDESVEKLHNRQCVVASNRPLLLFVQVSLDQFASQEQRLSYLDKLTTLCKKY